jgi:hypothetical protein
MMAGPMFGAMIFTPWMIILIIWSMVWKFIALWKCGRNNQLAWFIVLAIINTAGILEIIYLFFFRKNLNKRKK